MDTKHTPQRWYTMTKPDASQGLIADENTGENIAVSYDAKHAQLIAAAPDLLKALRTIRDRLTKGPRHNASDKTMRLIAAVADAAIKKVEGS